MDKFIKLTKSDTESYINVSNIIAIDQLNLYTIETVAIYYDSVRNSKATLAAGANTNLYEFVVDNVLKANNSSKTEIVFTPVNQPVLTLLSFT